jgi:hypothetical protein
MAEKFFHGEDHQMWTYCLYLGPYVSEEGVQYDLGVYAHRDGRVSLAAVYGSRPEQYQSGEMCWEDGTLTGLMKHAIHQEAWRRYQEQGGDNENA